MHVFQYINYPNEPLNRSVENTTPNNQKSIGQLLFTVRFSLEAL